MSKWRVVAVERVNVQIFTEFMLFTRIFLSTGHIVVHKTHISPCPHEALGLYVRISTNK